MAEKNFFDLFKEKMATLRPSEKHRDDDWATLNDRLNMALPEQPRKWRREKVLPLLLLAALLSSNAAWWQTHRHDRAALHRLETQVAGLQTSVAALEAESPVVRTDTVWRTVYVRSIGDLSFMPPTPKSLATQRMAVDGAAADRSHTASPISTTEQSSGAVVAVKIDNPANIAPETFEPTTRMAEVPFLMTPGIALPEKPDTEFSLLKNLTVKSLKEEKPVKPVRKKNLLDALRPKYFKIGANIGWFYAKSSGLMHEGGFSYGAEGVIGFSRHWSLTADYGAAQLHYKAHDPAAILGAPALPAPGYGHHLTEMDVTGQKIRQFNLGLRYTFSRPDKPRPFLGMGWGGLTVLPYTVEYEVEHEPTGAIHKGSFLISERTRLRNILRFGAGLEIPLSRSFDLTLEGYYLRRWKKTSDVAPDLMGVRGGVNWSF